MIKYLEQSTCNRIFLKSPVEHVEDLSYLYPLMNRIFLQIPNYFYFERLHVATFENVYKFVVIIKDVTSVHKERTR